MGAPLTAIVRSKQRIFFGKMYNNRINMSDDPLGFVLKFILSIRYNSKNYLDKLINNSNINDCQYESKHLKNNLLSSEDVESGKHATVSNFIWLGGMSAKRAIKTSRSLL